MDIKELDKKQLILLTLLITFVVSIATGIVTVSLMNQMPKSVPQTINNVIQRTIEKVKEVEVPTTSDVVDNKNLSNNSSLSLNGDNALIPIYSKNLENTITDEESKDNIISKNEKDPIGNGVIISDIGLILVESNIIDDNSSYMVILDKTNFNASVLKRFNNGFTILKISKYTDKVLEEKKEDNSLKTE